MENIEDENSSSSDSSIDENMEKEILSRAEKLEVELSVNKYLYEAHIEVIDIYRKIADLNSMREAYKRFHQCFPLTPKIWLEWIKDEIKIANTKEEQEEIMTLFDKAVEDYLSVDLWIEYAQYSIGVSDIQKTRAILEKGLTSAGLHASQGSLLWDTLREVEHAHISLYQKDSEEWVAQVKRLAEVFKRQLSIPLLNMENTYNEWTQWHTSLPEGLIDLKPIEWGYKKSLQTLLIYKPFEDKILSADSSELYYIYSEYIKAVKDTSTVLCLYERAILSLCLTPSLWEEYIKFSFKLKEVVLGVTARAVRNCTWSEELWIARIRILESYKVNEKELVDCFEQGLLSINPTPPVEFWFSMLEYYHRNSKDHMKLDKLFSQASEQILPEHDPTYKINRWYAQLSAEKGNMELARKIWSNIMNDPQTKDSYNAWCEYAHLEKRYGELNRVRNIYKRAIVSCRNWSNYILEEWLMFERQYGTLEDVMKCQEKLKNTVKTDTEYVSKINKDSGTRVSKRKYPDGSSQNKKYADEDYAVKKMKLSRDSVKKQISSKPIENKDPKTTVFVSNLHPGVTEEKLKEIFPNALNINVVLDKKGKSRCFGYVQFFKEEECMTALARDRTPIDGRPMFISELKSDKKTASLKYAQSIEDTKLFVKGIPLTKTKEDVEKIFKPYDPVDVRLVYKKNGQSKGIAYVEFKTAEDAQKALKGSESLKIDGEEILVAISAPPSKNPVDKSEQNEPIRHSRSRLQIPMVPRTLLVKNTADGKQQHNDQRDTSKTVSKSNDDFRKLFFKT